MSQNILFTSKIKSFLFVDEKAKEAYLRGCKVLAPFIASGKYKFLSLKIERSESNKNAFVFTLYGDIDISCEQKDFCKMCKEMHKAFFINEEYNCSRCNMKSLLKRLQQKSKIQREYFKTRLKSGIDSTQESEE